MLNNLKTTFLLQEIKILDDMILQAQREINESQREANYHVGAMQSRYDTFKEEAQYLVDAHKLRLAELKLQHSECTNLLKQYQTNKATKTVLSVGDLCVLSNDDNQEHSFFILPLFSKHKFIYKNREYRVVSVNAPIIAPFIGKALDDFCDVDNHPLEEFYITQIE